MKKLLLTGIAVCSFIAASAQQAISTPTVVIDTLSYFLNKQLFKVGGSVSPTFAYYKAPSANTTSSYTYVTHCGSVFKNSDTALIVTGLEAWASKNAWNVNNGISVPLPVHIYLYNVVNGLPVLPAIDSIVTEVHNACDHVTELCPPQFLSGNFVTPRKVKGDFAVMIRNYSSQTGDTVRFLRTSTLTHTSSALTAPGAQAYKTGEGFGIIRQNGAFHKTTDYTSAYGFGGVGTDYEFCVAPHVKFTLQVSQLKSPKADSSCVFDCITFTNTSSPEFSNRQFNLNEFYRQLKPFVVQPTSGGGFLPDSVMSWNFDDDHRLDTLPHVWGRVQDLFLGVDQSQICKTYDTIGHFMNCVQTGHYRKMTTCYSNAVVGRESFTTTIADCGNYYVGLPQIKSLDNVSVYPNPSVNGKVNISGLRGKTSIVVYNLLGQRVLSESSEADTVVLDLAKQPVGAYSIKISSEAGASKVVKLINRQE